MVEHRPWLHLLGHLILLLGVATISFPVYLTFIASTHESYVTATGQMPIYPGGELLTNYTKALFEGAMNTSRTPVLGMMVNSAIMAVAVAVGKIAISMLSAFAIVYFRFPLRMVFFWLIFLTLMLPVEVRILPTYKVMADLKLLDTYGGLIVPLLASATATLLFRQFFLTIPEELTEAAKMDGAGPLRFFKDILLPLSRTNMAALFVILFIYGWNQYLWPLLITTSGGMDTIVIGIKKMIGGADGQTDWGVVMATAILAMLPPVAVVIMMQRWFVKGLVDSEK